MSQTTIWNQKKRQGKKLLRQGDFNVEFCCVFFVGEESWKIFNCFAVYITVLIVIAKWEMVNISHLMCFHHHISTLEIFSVSVHWKNANSMRTMVYCCRPKVIWMKMRHFESVIKWRDTFSVKLTAKEQREKPSQHCHFTIITCVT